MVYEDFTDGWVEVDVGADRIQRTATHVDHSSVRNEITYLYKDYASNHFGNFVHLVDFRFVSGNWLGIAWFLANSISHILGCNPYIAVRAYGTTNKFYLTEYDGTQYDATSTLTYTNNVWYYLKITKSGTSLELKIYSDSARQTLLDTLNITLHTDYQFQYLYACSTWYLPPNTDSCVLDIDNLDIQEAVSKPVGSIDILMRGMGLI